MHAGLKTGASEVLTVPVKEGPPECFAACEMANFGDLCTKSSCQGNCATCNGTGLFTNESTFVTARSDAHIGRWLARLHDHAPEDALLHPD
jgi:hypothetical protein